MNDEAPKPRRKSPLVQFLRKFLLGAITIYLCVVLFLVFSETQLVFPGIKRDSLKYSNWEPEFEYEDVFIETADGEKIHGWYLPKLDASRNVLLFHGNAEDVPQVSEAYARRVGQAIDANVLVYDYRGFGKSTGVPNEANTIADGELMLDWLIKRSEKNGFEVNGSESIVYFGSSLGGGVANGVAGLHTPSHLVLDRTFDAITSPGAERFPWIPVKLIMRNRYDSANRIAGIDVPLFQSHFTEDELISIKFARRLFEHAKTSDKEFFEMPVGGHYDALPEEYWVKLTDYFASRETAKTENETDQTVEE